MIEIILIITELSGIHIPLILGAYISMSLMKVPDLSIESAYVFGAITGGVCSQYLLTCTSIPLGLTYLCIAIISLLGGACVGVISSFLTQYITLPHLLSSILTIGIFHGLNQLILSTPYLSLTGPQNPLALFSLIATHPEFIIILLSTLVISIAGAFFLRTQLGYALKIYGNNPQFFKNYNISTPYIFCSGIIVSNALAGYAGYVMAQSNNFVDITMGSGKPLLCITALILGKVITRNAQRNILVPVLGTICYFSIQQILLQCGFNLKYFTAVQACIMICLLAFFYKKNPQSIDNLGV